MIIAKMILITILSWSGIVVSGAIASAANVTHSAQIESTFQTVKQPTWLKTTVLGAGLGLIGLELWWFLSYQRKP